MNVIFCRCTSSTCEPSSQTTPGNCCSPSRTKRTRDSSSASTAGASTKRFPNKQYTSSGWGGRELARTCPVAKYGRDEILELLSWTGIFEILAKTLGLCFIAGTGSEKVGRVVTNVCTSVHFGHDLRKVAFVL